MRHPIALVTGCSRPTGLGIETCRQLLERGYTVVVTARGTGRAADGSERLVERFGSRAIAFDLDVTDGTMIRAAADMVRERFGRLDALVNNAGGNYDAGVDPIDVDLAGARESVDVQAFGAWRMVIALHELMPPGACVVNVSSASGSFGGGPRESIHSNPSFVPGYALSTLALNGLTVLLARSLAPRRIKVNAVCPGFTATYPGLAEQGGRPVPEGAAGIVWAATLPPDGPTGGFFRDGVPIPL